MYICLEYTCSYPCFKMALTTILSDLNQTWHLLNSGRMVYYLDEDVPDRETLSYWIDFHDPPPYEEYDRETWKEGTIEVPEIPWPLPRESFNLFKSQVNPLDRSDCHGLDLNIKAVEIIHGLFFTKSSTRIEFLLAEKSLKCNNY